MPSLVRPNGAPRPRMFTPVLRGFEEYSCTVGTSSLMRLTLNDPVSVTRSPPTTETGIGTSCTDPSRGRASTVISSFDAVAEPNPSCASAGWTDPAATATATASATLESLIVCDVTDSVGPWPLEFIDCLPE